MITTLGATSFLINSLSFNYISINFCNIYLIKKMVAIFLTCVKNNITCSSQIVSKFLCVFSFLHLFKWKWIFFKGIHISYKESYKIWKSFEKTYFWLFIYLMNIEYIFFSLLKGFSFYKWRPRIKCNSLFKLYDKMFYLIINLVSKQSCTLPHLSMK